MNRQQRRASRFKREQWDRNRQADPAASLNPIAWSRDFNTEEAATFSNEARLAWHHITHGSGTTDHFDTLAHMANVLVVRAEQIDPTAEELATRAQQALVAMKSRYLRVGRMGADAAALEHLPRALDMYDQLLRLSTPLQMTHALRETLARMQRGEVLGAAGGGGA